MSTHWIILTGEYPPQSGGVADYSRQIAEGLQQAGDEVQVVAPRLDAKVATHDDSPVRVTRLPDHFGWRGIRALRRIIADAPRPCRLLVQYVPHAYGCHAMNLLFASFIRRLGRKGVCVWTMFHEVAVDAAEARGWKHKLLAGVTGTMADQVANGSERIFVSIPAWADRIRRIVPADKPIEWLPVPANIPIDVDRDRVAALRDDLRRRAGLSADGHLIAHFGTYGQLITTLLEPAAMRLLSQGGRALVLVGRGSETFRDALHAHAPALTPRVLATGLIDALPAAEHLAACDLMLQPYPDGLSCRRSTVMAGLALGTTVVSNLGLLSEPFWSDSGAVTLAPSSDPASLVDHAERLLDNADARSALSARGRALYAERFDVSRTIAALRQGGRVNA